MKQYKWSIIPLSIDCGHDTYNLVSLSIQLWAMYIKCSGTSPQYKVLRSDAWGSCNIPVDTQQRSGAENRSPVSQQHPCNNHPRQPGQQTTTATTTTVNQTTNARVGPETQLQIHNNVCNKKEINSCWPPERISFPRFPGQTRRSRRKGRVHRWIPGQHCFRWNVSRVFRSRVRSIQCDYGVY